MTELLSRLFVKNRKNVTDPTVRAAYGTLGSVTGILLNLLLFAAKFTVGVLFGSVSIRADGMNNLSDAASQLISLFSFRISSKPADREHPFGHARIEYVASMIVSLLILLVGGDLLRESIEKIFSPVLPELRWAAVFVLAAPFTAYPFSLGGNFTLNPLSQKIILAAALFLIAAIFSVAVKTLLHKFLRCKLRGDETVFTVFSLLLVGIGICHGVGIPRPCSLALGIVSKIPFASPKYNITIFLRFFPDSDHASAKTSKHCLFEFFFRHITSGKILILPEPLRRFPSYYVQA